MYAVHNIKEEEKEWLKANVRTEPRRGKENKQIETRHKELRY